MKLTELLTIANEGYGDDLIAQYFDLKTGQETGDRAGDTLALFIGREISDTYDPNMSDEDQIEEVLRLMNNARGDIDRVSSAFISRLVQIQVGE